MLTTSANWKRSMGRSGVKPVFRAVFTLGPVANLVVSNYSAATGAINISTTLTTWGGVTTTQTQPITPGVDFAIGASNTATAANIAACISGLVTAGPNTTVNINPILQIVAYSIGPTVIILPSSQRGIISDITLTPANTSGWFARVSVPYQTAFCSDDFLGRDPVEVPLIAGVSNVSNTLDPMTRQQTIGSVDLVMSEAGGIFRALLALAVPHNRTVQLSIGTSDLAATDFAPVGTFVIDELLPEPGAITLRLVEPIMLAAETKISANFFASHPVSVIASLLSRMSMPAQFFDATTLDCNSASYADISHWAVSRHNWYTSLSTGSPGPHVDGTWPNCNNGVADPTPIKDLIDDLCKVCNFGFLWSETGIYGLSRYNGSAASVRDLTDDDVDDFAQLHTVDNQVTNVVITGAANGVGAQASSPNGTGVALANVSDYVARASYTGGNVLAQKSFTIQSQWIGTPSFIFRNFIPTDTSLYVQPGTLAGMCGTVPSSNALGGAKIVDPQPQPTQGAQAFLSNASTPPRLSYLMVTDGSKQEMLVAQSHSWLTDKEFNWAHNRTGPGNVYYVDIIDPGNYFDSSSAMVAASIFNPDPNLAGANDNSWNTVLSDIRGTSVWSLSVFNILHRDYFKNGISPTGFYSSTNSVQNLIENPGNPEYGFPLNSARVYDCTIALSTAESLLARFRLGAPVVQIRVPLANWDLQVGDFVTLHNAVYLGLNGASADGGTVFEITKKELLALEDSPGVMLELTWVRDNFTPTTGGFSGDSGNISPSSPVDNVITDNSFTIVTDASLNILTRV